jgi:hypothetical protein
VHRASHLLSVKASLNLKGQHLADGWSTCAGWKSFDVDEYVLSALSGLQKAKATLIVPNLECSGNPHPKIILRIVTILAIHGCG